MIERLAIGLLLSLLIAGAGWRANALTARGALAAVFVGTAVIGGASWVGGLLLGAFFVSSSLLSRLPSRGVESAKGSRRDERQVLANGGAAALAALASPWLSEAATITLVASALAAATADTWATELGSRSGRQPRLLLSRALVPPGLSGGVTAPGTFGSLAGAAWIAAIAAFGVSFVDGPNTALLALVIVVAGAGGSTVDSLLGELAQQRRRCDGCGALTEADVHHCGTSTTHVAGIRWVDNDVVNLACTASGLILGSLGWALIA